MTRLCIIFALCLPLAAQDAVVTGLIRHSSGMRIEHAAVLLVNQATGVRRLAWSNTEGYYGIAGVQPGVYKITTRKDGFLTTSRLGVRLDVGQMARIDFTIDLGMVQETVTVRGDSYFASTEDMSIGTVVDRDLLDGAPLNGRGLLTALEIAPGVTITPAGQTAGESGQFSVNGQRANSNYVTVDGISVNSGAVSGGAYYQGMTGVTPALSSIGSMHNLVTLDALDEFRVETANAGAEFGRVLGAQVLLSTRSGNNDVHGSGFLWLRNEALDANDWFRNAERLRHERMRLWNPGATVGGPLQRNRMFFFLSYEAIRLRQEPRALSSTVPDLPSRSAAIGRLGAFLNAFPMPNGPALGNGFAQYANVLPSPSALDNLSLRVDRSIGSRGRWFARVSHAPSSDSFSKAALGFDTLTTGLDLGLGRETTLAARFNISHSAVGSAPSPETNLVLPDLSAFFPPSVPPASSYLISTFFPIPLMLSTGSHADHHEWQQNLNLTFSRPWRSHRFSWGGDYRLLRPYLRNPPETAQAIYTDLNSVAAGNLYFMILGHSSPVSATIRNLSLFATDTWKLTSRVTLSGGLRWEFEPPPNASGNTPFVTLTGWPDPARIAVAPPGTPLWRTRYDNFAPRAGVAVKLDQDGAWVLRLAGGLFHDTGLGLVLANLTSLPPFSRSDSYFNVSTSDASRFPEGTGVHPQPTVLGYAPDFRLPRSFQWNAVIERVLGESAAVSLAYVGASDNRLIRPEKLQLSDGPISVAEFVSNDGSSHFESLQAQFRARLTHSLHAVVSYDWSHSIDNVSKDAAFRTVGPGITPRTDRGNSDFDVRHSAKAMWVFEPPLFGGWSLSGVWRARTGFPLEVANLSQLPPLSPFLPSYRVDLNGGIPVWITDAKAPGGRRLNLAAFGTPGADPPRQGTLGRNAISGFGMSQIDLAIARELRLAASWSAQLRLEVFNALNHPNFSNPVAYTNGSPDANFGVSPAMLNQGLADVDNFYRSLGGTNGGLNPAFQIGGPRMLQAGIRFHF
jgi:hypothetical protein